MGIKSRLLEQMKTSLLWGEKEIRIGRVSILACDLSLSVNLLRRRSQSEMETARLADIKVEEYVPTYGLTVEPFLFSVMGSNGDICWQSPGLDVTHKLCIAALDAKEDDNWLNLGDLVVQECHIQGRHGADYIFGDRGCPCLGNGLRFRDPTKSFCGEEEFTPQDGDGQQEVSQLGDHCHSVQIHRDDAMEFVRRVKQTRSYFEV